MILVALFFSITISLVAILAQQWGNALGGLSVAFLRKRGRGVILLYCAAALGVLLGIIIIDLSSRPLTLAALIVAAMALIFLQNYVIGVHSWSQKEEIRPSFWLGGFK